MQTRTQTISCFLTHHYELLEVASFLSVLAITGSHYNFRAFRIQLLAAQALAPSNAQVALAPVLDLSRASPDDVLFIPGSYSAAARRASAATLAVLAQLAPKAPLIVCASSGALLLAQAGVLAGQRIASTGSVASSLTELEPLCAISALPVETHGRFISSVDASGCQEAALRVVSRIFGSSLARRAAADLGLPEPLAFDVAT